MSWVAALVRTLMDSQPADLASNTFERPRIEAFDMHPIDYALMQKAAALSDLPEADFVQLAVYLHSRDLVAQWSGTSIFRPDNPAAQPPVAEHQSILF